MKILLAGADFLVKNSSAMTKNTAARSSTRDNNLNYFNMKENNRLNISGIELSLTKKRIKNAYIYIKPPEGAVSLSVPVRMSMAEVERFVTGKREWIIKTREKMLSMPHIENSGVESGDTVYVWGRPFIIRCEEEASKNGYEISDIFLKLKFKNGYSADMAEKLIKKMYAAQLKARLEQRLPVWEDKTGLKCSSWSVRYMTSRWGSCNTVTHKINFSTRLAEKDPVFLEYVILHELAHTKVANHGEKFKRILDLYMEDWRQIRKKLR